MEKEARLKKNVPKTLDNTREVDETIIGVDDDEVFEEEVSDEFSKYFQDGLSQRYSMALMHLPNGPTPYFRLTNVKLSHEIYGHGRSSNHKPELILNNFNTRLVHTISRWFQAYFLMCHSFKEDRYNFQSKDKVELQEIGTKFTLKLKWLQKGTFNKNNEYEWMFKPELETSKK
ncbi:566_t:CDS:2 [Entrophospora sp. SA101]|nr:566_t:CDS:2 [Entrophospora sp. SA101]